ncbi:MAG TPA: hypothetical protein VIL19_10090 [Casimicrobiaceae bacterium]
MKTTVVLLALACAACASNEQVAKEDVYHPPVYRTGSNILSQGSGASNTSDGTGDAMRQALPPALVRKPPGG